MKLVQCLSRLNGEIQLYHTGPKKFVSSIAGDVIRTPNDFSWNRGGGKKTKSQTLYQLCYPTSFKELAIFYEIVFKNIFLHDNLRFLPRGQEKRVQQLRILSKRPFRPDSECEINTAWFSYKVNAYLWLSQRFLAIRRN